MHNGETFAMCEMLGERESREVLKTYAYDRVLWNWEKEEAKKNNMNNKQHSRVNGHGGKNLKSLYVAFLSFSGT